MAAKLSLGGTEANGRRGRNAVQGDGQESAAATIPIDNVKGSAGRQIGIGKEIKKDGKWQCQGEGEFGSRQKKKEEEIFNTASMATRKEGHSLG